MTLAQVRQSTARACCGWLAVLSAPILGWSVAAQSPLATAFPYRGYLEEASVPASGTYDFEVRLFDAATAGAPVGTPTPLVHEDVAVVNGRFDLRLDFGADAFAAGQRWVQVGVRAGTSTGAFTPLAARQAVTPTPVALHAPTAATIGPGLCASGDLLRWAQGAWVCSSELPSGNVAAVAAGAGLTGGTITDRGTIGIAPGGITRDMLADRAVTFAAIAPGAIGAAQIDATVQRRVAGTCPPGQFMRAVGADGSPLCAGMTTRVTTTLSSPSFFPAFGEMQMTTAMDRFPLLVWRNFVGQVLVTRCRDAACARPTSTSVIDEDVSRDLSLVPAVATGADGRPVIAYVDRESNLVLARCSDVGCRSVASRRVVGMEKVGDRLSGIAVAVATDGRPKLLYVGTPFLHLVDCLDAECASSYDIYLFGMSDFGAQPLLAVGRDRQLLIANRNKVMVCEVSCRPGEDVVQFPASMVFQSIVVDAAGFPVLSYWDGNGSVTGVVRCGNANCSTGNTTSTIATGTRERSAVALDSRGLPQVFHVEAATSTLWWVRCGTTDCSSGNSRTALDTSLGYPGAPSVLVDSEGLPLVVTTSPTRAVKCLALSCE